MRTIDYASRALFINKAKLYLGNDSNIVTREDIANICDKFDLKRPHWLLNSKEHRAGRGNYYLDTSKETKEPIVKAQVLTPSTIKTANLMQMEEKVEAIKTFGVDNYIPRRIPGYEEFGFFNELQTIMKRKIFYPVFITGMSGNGKTIMPEEIHARLGRELIRVNITSETDEDDLLGGFRLQDGHTVWHNGPVITAMERGATLLLDEIDLASHKIMCLQPVLEGKAIFLKKISKVIYPEEGFNIIATANTKGRGSEDGRFIGTNILNEAFLERFVITFEQEYPPNKIEKRILDNNLALNKIDPAPLSSWTQLLVDWAEVIRNTYNEGAISDVISTRRLVHIIQTYAIFGNKKQAVERCVARFDDTSKDAFLELYDKLDGTTKN